MLFNEKADNRSFRLRVIGFAFGSLIAETLNFSTCTTAIKVSQVLT